MGTVDEVIEAGEAMGLEEVGISDHYVVYPGYRRMDWSMPVEELESYVADVRTAAQHASIPVRLGIEVDYLPETIEETLAIVRSVEFDYLIGSVHFIDGFPVDGHRKYWDSLTQEEVDATWKAYYRRVCDMAATGGFDIAAHLDLPKKFGTLPQADLTGDVLAALDAIAASDMVMEMNTSGWYQTGAEIYPAPWIIAEARARGIPIVITADAHHPSKLTRDFERAMALARDAGYESVVRFQGRRRFSVPLG